MKIPPDQNKRAEAMWRIISQNVDFRERNVADLGCGTGDFLWRAYVAGAERVVGVDNKAEILLPIMKQYEGRKEISTMGEDISTLANMYGYDIALCFSVLPYLKDYRETLQWMKEQFPVCIIEAQYVPEPYGLTGIPNDAEMKNLLVKSGFMNCEVLGKTYVDIHDSYRTIWKCT